MKASDIWDGGTRAALASCMQEWNWCKSHPEISEEERLERALMAGISMAVTVAREQYKRANSLHATLQRFAIWKGGQYVRRDEVMCGGVGEDGCWPPSPTSEG